MDLIWHIIYKNKNKERPKYGTLSYTGLHFQPIRVLFIDDHSLFSS